MATKVERVFLESEMIDAEQQILQTLQNWQYSIKKKLEKLKAWKDVLSSLRRLDMKLLEVYVRRRRRDCGTAEGLIMNIQNVMIIGKNNHPIGMIETICD